MKTKLFERNSDTRHGHKMHEARNYVRCGSRPVKSGALYQFGNSVCFLKKPVSPMGWLGTSRAKSQF